MKFYQLTKLTLLTAGLLLGSAQAEMVLRRGNCAEPLSLDPQINGDVQGGHILRDLFEGLVAEDSEGNIVPGVAKSWDVSEDGLTYTFHLRDSLWSDGKPLTAEDFVYAWQRAVMPETGNSYAFLLFPVKNAEAIVSGKEKDLTALGVKATDAKTLTVTLAQPTPYFLGLLTHSITYPAPRQTVEKYKNAWTKPENIISNGAFKMSTWTPQASMELVKSDNYWDKDAVKLDKVIYYPTEDRNAELKRFRAGELDWTCDIPNNQLPFIKKNLADSLIVGEYLGTFYYGFNTTKPPFKDNLPLRKALTLAINREKLTEKVTGTEEKPAYNLVMQGVADAKPYIPSYAKLSQDERNEIAKKLYAEAGYSKDNPLEVELRFNTSSNHKKVAIAIAAMWKDTLGVKTNLANEEWKVFLQTRKQKNTQVFRAGWIGDYNDANTFLEIFTANSGKNDVGFYSQSFDDKLAQAAQEQDKEKRADLLQSAEKELLDAFVVTPLYFYVNKLLVSPKVKGYHLNVMNHTRSKYIWIEE